MADWLQDLQDLLGETGENVWESENTPFNELAAGDWWGAATAPASAAMNFLNIPLTGVKYGTGALIGGVNEGLGMLDAAGVPGAGFAYEPETSRAFQEGGPMAAFEQVRSEEPLWFQFPTEIGLDPTTVLGLGAVRRPTQVLRAMSRAEELAPATRGISGGLATGLETAQFLWDELPYRAISPITRPAGQAVKRGVKKVMPNAFEFNPESRLLRTMTDVSSAFDRVLENRRGITGRQLPAIMQSGIKALSPIGQYDVPPIFDTEFDSGVPSRIKQLAWDAWQRQRMSHPNIPGINAPGMTTTPSGYPRFEGQRPGGPGRRLGIVNIPPGGFQTPFDPGLREFDEQDLKDMAVIGASAMLDFDNDISNQLYRNLRRAGPGMQRVRDAIIKKYGPGIEPYIPAMYDDMVALLNESGFEGGVPSREFLTRWGFPEGVISTKRLDAYEKAVKRGGRAGREKYLTGTNIDYQGGITYGSPELVESGAAMGAGYLQASADQPLDAMGNVWEGPFAGEIGTKGELLMPQGFVSQFHRNAEGYDTYMRQLFGDIPDDEMETLRRMSIRILYDELMNAASEVSGGARGALGMLEKGPPIPNDRGGFTNYTGDEQTKIGVYPGDVPGAIAANLEAVQPDLPGGQIGKPSMLQLNKRRYRDVTGNEATRAEYNSVMGTKLRGNKDLTEVQVREMMAAKGITSLVPNPRGGVLPNTQMLLDAWNAGKDIPVAGSTAKKWYRNSANEVMAIVGPGRYEDAMMLIDLMAITSAGTGVEANARNALRAFAEWKLGSDETIRKGLGLTQEQADALLNRGERWAEIAKPKGWKKGDPPYLPPGYETFMGAMADAQKRESSRLFANYVERRMAAEPMPWTPTQGGPKTNNFAGSFVIKLWQDAITYTMPEGPVRDKVMKALDDAATIYTVDRHDARISNLGTAVTPISAIAQRQARLIAAKQLPNVRPEDMQAATWYWSKDRQGFLRVDRNDDMAQSLRNAWNEKINPGDDARIREMIREERPDITDAELDQVADDLMRQEVVMNFIREALDSEAGKARWTEVMGEGNPLESLSNLGDDMLGIINRASRGVAPWRKASVAIPKLVDTAENTLKQIAEGQSQGVTLAYDGSEFVPETPTTGFAVALTSAGRAVSTRKRKTSSRSINEFLQKFGDLLDDPGMAERIRFGLFEMDDPSSASFDLTLIIPDESTAVDIARRANQKAIYSFADGRVIDTGGDGNSPIESPEMVRDIIREVFGDALRGSRANIRDVLARGVTIDEMDSVNPVSILQRRVVKPIMDWYQKDSMGYLLDKKPEWAANAAVPTEAAGIDPTTPFDFSAIEPYPLLSTQENHILGQTFDDGEMYGNRLERYHDEGEADLSVLKDSGVTWGPNADIDERIAAAGGNRAVEDLIRKYDKDGIDLLYADPRSLANLRFANDLAAKEGVKFDKFNTWDLVRAAWGEQALFSPKYHLGNIQGAWLQNAFGGTFRIGTPTEFLAAFKLARGGLDDLSREEALHSLHAYQVASKWGFGELPTYISRGGVRDMTSNRGRRISRSAMGEVVGRATRSRRVGQAVGRPFSANADLSQAVETVMRGALWSDVLDREMSLGMNLWEDELATMAARQGLEDFEFSITRAINPIPGGKPSAAKIKDHLQTLGFQKGYAERAARNFSEIRNKAEKLAKKELDKRQFSYERTNLDEFVGKFIPFHYWLSRAIRYYGEESLRHPFVILNYMRLNEGIESAQDDPGLSASQKGFIRLMGTPLGFSLLMNPEAMFGVVKIFGLDTNFEPEGETEAGGVVRWLKERGMGLYPWIDGTLNLMGVYGDTFEPDLLGIRHKTLIGSAVNFMRSQLGMEPANAPYANAMGQARGAISTLVSEFTPDWLTRPVSPKAGGSSTDATIDSLIESRIIANNPGMANADLIDIMADPESEPYQEAYRQVASAGIIQQLLNFTLPQNYRMREDTRDVRSRQIKTIYEAAAKQGVSPFEFAPKQGDLEFAETYERQTGKRWKPGDYENARTLQDISRAPEEAKGFVYQQAEFQKLGTPRQRAAFKKYQALAYGEDHRTIGMDPEAAREFANIWADQHGHAGDINEIFRLREAFERTHPEFGQFRVWQDQMYTLRNHLGGNLDEYRRQAAAQNPNAARYFQETDTYVKSSFPQSQWKAKLEEYTTSADAYAAIHGMATNRYDPAALPGTPPFDVTAMQMAPAVQPQGMGYPDWMQNLSNVSPGYGMNTFGTWWNR